MGRRLSIIVLAGAALLAGGCVNPLLDKITGITAGKNQKITVTVGATPLAGGDSYNFGAVAIGGHRDVTFTVTNTGNSPLGFTGAAPVQATGDFSVPSQPSGPLAPGASATFVLRFAPAANEGLRSQSITIASDDPAQGAFAFTVKGFVSTVGLPRTGQTTSYAAGDDGSLQKGVAWPATRFLASGSMMTDTLTGLQWAINANLLGTNYLGIDNDGIANDGKVTWQHALDFIAYLNSQGFGDPNVGWHLPNRDEMRSLADYEQSDVGAWLKSLAPPFTNVQSNYYWTSTTIASTGNMFVLDMSSGRVATFVVTNFYYVWPVRTASTVGSVRLPVTGQTTAVSIGNRDDGDLQKGVAWPSPRFVNNGNGTVTDNLTGLMWKNTTSSSIVWASAIALGAGDRTGGYSDWRLPNVDELDSLINAGASDSSTYLIGQGLSAITNANYWTSTTNAFATGEAWMIQMGTGIFGTRATSLTLPAILVRNAP